MYRLARAYLAAYRATAIGLAVLFFLAALALPYLLTLNTQAATAWVEPFASASEVQADWQTMGAPCYSVPQAGKLRMTCQSAGLVTRQTWSRQFSITATVQVSATTAPGSSNDRYFAGLTIYDNASGDTQYGEIALVRGVPPFQSLTVRSAGVLVNDGGYWTGPASAGWHTLQAVYLPAGQYKLYLDGALVSTVTPYRPLQRDPDIFILCVSVGEATPNDGSAALCEFGPVTVQGVRSETVSTAYLPSVASAKPMPRAYP